MTTPCPACSFPIQVAPSKRIQTCKNCKSIARTGFSLQEIAAQKQKEWKERSRLKAKTKQDLKAKSDYRIPARSAKGKQQAKEVEATKIKLKQAAKQDGFTECQGCGKFVKQIEGSHKIPLSRSIALASEEENIRLLCGECHPLWEHLDLPDVVDLNCFLEDMLYIFRVDNDRFWRLFQKILDFHEKTPTAKVGRAIKVIEKFE